MKKYTLLLLFLIILTTAIIVPSGAILTPEIGSGTGNYTQSYNSTSYFHDTNYIPLDIEYLFILIGFTAWIISVFTPVCEDIFALISPVGFALAAWYAAFVTTETTRVVSIVANGIADIYTVHTQIIMPLPGLQIAMVLCFIFSLLSAVYIIFLRNVDRKLDQKKKPEGSEK